MNNEQEAQQAQAIDKSVNQLRGWLKENSVNGLSRGPFYDNIESVLNHVDSQAQKIADQAKEIEKLKANRSLVPLDSEHESLR